MPGVGKSRLIREFAPAAGRARPVVRGRCLPYGDGITFWPIAEMVRGVAGIAAMTRRRSPSARIARLSSELRGAETDRTPVVDRVGRASAWQTQFPVAELFWGIRKLLEALAREQPLVMIVDDIHAAEPTLLDLLDHLVETVETRRSSCSCSARHELVGRHADWAGAARPPAGTAATLRRRHRPDDRRAARPHRARVRCRRTGSSAAAEGNPLFVEQMVSMLIETGRSGGTSTGCP